MFDALFGSVQTGQHELSDGTRLALISSVPTQPKGVVLLAHGFTGSKEDFLFCIPGLAEQGYAAVAWDHRGTYESPAEGPYDVAQLSLDLLELAGHWRSSLGVPLHLIGHSFGGLVVERAAALDGLAPDSITLVCSGPGGMGPVERVLVLRDLIRQGHSLDEIFRRKRELDNDPLPEMLENFLRERFVTSSVAAVDAMAEAIIDTPDQIAPIIERGIPAFVMYGERDGSWPQPVQNDMAERLGTAPQVIPDAVHTPTLENPDYTVGLITHNLDGLAADQSRTAS